MDKQSKISIDSDGIAQLGDRLGQIADYLEEKAATKTSHDYENYGFPGPLAAQAYGSVLGDYELKRKKVCKDLRALRDFARKAGGVYVLTENLIDERNRGQL